MHQSPKTLGKIFTQRIFKTPHKLGIGWIEHNEIKSLSFLEYRNKIEILALGLDHHKVLSGEKIAILSQTCKEWHLLDMAIMLSRGCVVPIYPSYIPKEIASILNHSDASMLIVENEKTAEKLVPILKNIPKIKLIISIHELSKELTEKLQSKIEVTILKDIFKIGLEKIKSHPDFLNHQIQAIGPDDLASIIYTSGTTGEPKGAIITQFGFASMLTNVEKSVKEAFDTKDRSLVFLPLSHVLGRCDSLLPLIFGWHAVYAESFDKLRENMQIVKPTIMLSVPRIFEKVYSSILDKINSGSMVEKQTLKWASFAAETYFKKIDKDQSPNAFEIFQYQMAYKLVFSKIYHLFGGKIRYLVSGGAPLSTDIIKFFRHAGLTILEGYGLTETIGPCYLNPLIKQIPGTAGKPCGDVQIKFADDGEILVKSDSIMAGYYKNDEGTKETIVDGWLYTGDVGELTSEGYLKITDRKKDIIITSSGKNIAPQKIENLARSKPHISHLVVIGDKKNYLTALVGIDKEHFFNDFEALDLASDCTIKEIATHTKVKEIIQREIDQINSELSHFETIKKFEIITEEFTTNNFLTPSLKVKRKYISKFYKDRIEAMYQ